LPLIIEAQAPDAEAAEAGAGGLSARAAEGPATVAIRAIAHRQSRPQPKLKARNRAEWAASTIDTQ
jgi:hypothetical protein